MSFPTPIRDSSTGPPAQEIRDSSGCGSRLVNTAPQLFLSRGSVRRAAFVFPLVILLAMASAGCTRSGGEEARAQYARAVAAVKAGSLAEAYTATLPLEYDRDLNELLEKLRALISEEEFHLLRNTASKVATELAPVLSVMAGGMPLLGHVAEKLKALPGALGPESYAAFRRLDIEGLLGVLDHGFFAELARRPDFPGSMKSIEVQLKDFKGDWARLQFESKSEGGRVEKEVVDVILVGERWVPDNWVVDWPAQMKQLKARFEELAELKKEDPLLIRDQLRAFESQLEDPAPLLEALLKKLGAG